LLGGYFLFLGGDALPKAVGVLGILGALAIWTALWMTGRAWRERLVAGASAVGLAVYTGVFATWHWVASWRR